MSAQAKGANGKPADKQRDDGMLTSYQVTFLPRDTITVGVEATSRLAAVQSALAALKRTERDLFPADGEVAALVSPQFHTDRFRCHEIQITEQVVTKAPLTEKELGDGA